MAKVTNEDRHQYFEKIKFYKTLIQSLLKQEENVVQSIKKDNQGAALKRLTLADEMLSLSAYYMIINGISQAVLQLRNEESLNDSRKSLYKSVIYLEEVVSPYVDAPFADYEERLTAIIVIGAKQRYNLIRKIGLALRLLESAYGDNTKWRWSFVELEGRFAAVAKNILNLKTAVANTDPNSPDYEPTMYHLRLIKKLLMQAADRYREKYELSTNRMDDFKMAVNFINALRRIHALLGERVEAETLKKKAEIWSLKLETDHKKHEDTSHGKA